MADNPAPIGAILAGGRGRRIGGAKACVELAGRPLIAYPLAVLEAALGEVVVIAKRDTALPALAVPVWREPDEPRHPLAGIVCALERAAGRAVLVSALDLPFLTVPVVRRVAVADARGRPLVVPRAGGRLQPLLMRCEPAALDPLAAALRGPLEPLTATVARLDPHVLDFERDADAFRGVNVPEELRTAAALLARRRAVD